MVSIDGVSAARDSSRAPWVVDVQHEERAPVGTAERTGDAVAARSVHDVGDLAALDHPHEAVGDRRGDPHAVLGVEADAVGVVGQLGPHPPVGERAVVGEVERGEALARALGHDEGAVVGRDRHAVGHAQVGCRVVHRAVGVDPQQRGRDRRAAAPQVVAELADERVPVAVDDHVVDLVRRDAPRGRRAPRACVPSQRITRRAVIDETSSVPSGSQPRPDGWSTSTTVDTAPSAVDARAPRRRACRTRTARHRASGAPRGTTVR